MTKAPKIAGGIASLVDTDILGPATAQFPSSSSTLDTAINVAKNIIYPIATNSPNKQAEVKEGLKRTIIALRNWWDIMDASTDREGWVLDADGNKKYNIYNDWDKFKLAIGAMPQSKTLLSMTHRSIMLNKMREEKQASEIIKAFRNKMQESRRRGVDMDIAVGSAVEIARNAMIEKHMSWNTFKGVLKNMDMSPGLKDILSSELELQPGILDRYEDIEKRYPGSVFPRAGNQYEQMETAEDNE
jgi:hypothetical protein